jgi:hypothetical protein
MTVTLITKDGNAVVYNHVVAIEHDDRTITVTLPRGVFHVAPRQFYEDTYYVD